MAGQITKDDTTLIPCSNYEGFSKIFTCVLRCIGITCNVMIKRKTLTFICLY